MTAGPGALRRRLTALPPCVVRTSRLELRLPDPRRTPEVVRLLNDPTVVRWTLGIPAPYRPADARAWLRRARLGRRNATYLVLQVVRRDDGALVGGVGLHHFDPPNAVAELGYWVGRPFRRRGYGAEAAAAMTALAFRRLGFHRVEAKVLVGNARSAGVLRALGFRREGLLRESVRKDGRPRDEYLFARLATDGPVPRSTGVRLSGTAPRSRRSPVRRPRPGRRRGGPGGPARGG